MAVADVDQALTETAPWQTCAVCHQLAKLTPTEADTYRGWLANKGVKFKDLEAKLAADPDLDGIPWATLSRHARAGCSAKERLR